MTCKHTWYFDEYENGNTLEVEADGTRVWCRVCSEEWFHR